MASGNSLSSREGVGWQVDLPGLASLVLNLGAAGLKRFAQAGVDFHTVLCMGEIAEKCPASAEFRRHMMVCRQEQRSQSRWLFKVVEIGAATNFVADELLKTRAGENIVALMSTILPILPDNMSDRILLRLFEESGASLDKTPGLNQLYSIKQSLAPLANRIDFKDRAYQYHIFLRHLVESSAEFLQNHVHKAIPDEATISKLIIMLSRLMLQDSRTILEYRGFPGSGWLVAYAQHVLGLSVCVMRSASSPVPVSGNFEDARVIVHIYDVETSCKILTSGRVQDAIHTQGISLDDSPAWTIHVDNVNLMNLHNVCSAPLREAFSIIGHSLVQDYVKRLAGNLKSSRIYQETFRREGIVAYPEYCSSEICARARVILMSFGLSSPEEESLQGRAWEQYVSLGSGQQLLSVYYNVFKAKPRQKLLAAASEYDVRSHVPTKSGGGSIESNPVEYSQEPQFLLRLVLKLVKAASWLAFTNWDQTVRTISVGFLDSSPRRHSNTDISGPNEGDEDSSPRLGYDGTPLNWIFRAVLDFVCGIRQQANIPFDDSATFAFQSRGVVFCNSVAVAQAFDLKACFIDMLPGSIMLQGEPGTKIVSRRKAEGFTGKAFRKPLAAKHLRPVDLFPSLDVKSSFEFEHGHFILSQDAIIDGQVLPLLEPGHMSSSLIDCCLPPTCAHGYDTPFDIAGLLSELSVGLKYEDSSELEDPSNALVPPWVQAVDRNPLGQFLSYQTYYNHPVTLLQRDCCLKCAFEVQNKINSLSQNRGEGRIVCARLPGEHMN